MEDQFSLAGRTALITGGSRGIGFAIAQAFIGAGARVILTARGEAGLRTAEAQLGPNAIGLRCDNGDPADIARMVADAWRISQPDILVNNAAISPYYKRIEDVTPEEWDAVVDVNLRGMYFCSQEVAKRWFEAGRGGAILSVSSVLGSVPDERLGVYAATKAGVNQLTRVMALEWADRGVRVNAIAPGWVETEFSSDLLASRHGGALQADIPMQRVATPEDITGAAIFLASDASRYVTGAVIPVDGGRALR